MAEKKNEPQPAVKPSDRQPSGHMATDKEYRDMPDKPDETTVAQVEIRPEEK